MLDEVEERLHCCTESLPVVGRGAQCLTHTGHQDVDMLLENGQIQVQLAREVLVENRFTDSGSIGDLVHAGGVETPVDEQIASRLEQLPPALITGHPATAGAFGRTRGSQIAHRDDITTWSGWAVRVHGCGSERASRGCELRRYAILGR